MTAAIFWTDLILSLSVKTAKGTDHLKILYMCVTPAHLSHISGEKFFLLGLHRDLRTFGSLSWSLGLKWSWGYCLGLSLGLWLAESMTLAHVALIYFPSFGWVRKTMAEIVVGVLWYLWLIHFGLWWALLASEQALNSLTLFVCIFFRPFLLCFLTKHMILKNLVSTSLRDLYFYDKELLIP